MSDLPRSFAAAESELHEAAVRASGLEEFGDTEYLEGLRTLLAGYDEEADPSPAGRHFFWLQTVESLKARLRSERGWAEHPECRGAPIERPLFIVGLPRTGTTALHRMLAEDPQFQGLEMWLGDVPKVRPPREAWADDPDFRECDERLRTRNRASPEMNAIHPMAAEWVDECWHLKSQSFANCTYECNASLPGYSAWYAAHDQRPAYRRHRDNLNLIGHGQPQRWLLKDADHLFGLDALLDVYPDARVVFTHRDPVRLLPSVCSLLRASRTALDARLDLERLGRDQFAMWERGIYSTLDARRGHDPAQFYDLQFHDFQRDPLECIRKIYAQFGLDLSDEAERRIQAWRDANPPGAHGGHIYSLDDFGLDEGEILERFRAYTDTFDIPRG
ncbi:MAG: sulfotransferase [Proteobacteria bacterium]|nr:sulfotransferase [Pseudomonadota bacterium]